MNNALKTEGQEVVMTYDYKACPDVIAVAEALAPAPRSSAKIVEAPAPRSSAKIAEEIRWIQLDKEIRLFARRLREIEQA